MSKRTDAIRSLFTTPTADALSADNMAAKPRVSAGAVRSLQDTFSDVENENERLRASLANREAILQVDPSLIDPSPIVDRLTEASDESYESLKSSIAQRGQEVPALLRPHPTAPGRYQTAYGHRRVRVAKELGRPISAIVRPMSDDELVVAQGVENAAREDLTFIERALFALRLEERDFDRTVVQQALNVDRAEASKLISVARSVPSVLIEAIGRAPKVGRGRWQAFAEALRRSGAVKRVRKALENDNIRIASSDLKFMKALEAASAQLEERSVPPQRGALLHNGAQFARVDQTARELRLTLNRAEHGQFADFLLEKLPSLFAEYVATERMSHPET